ncbi:hypothetical protein C0992_004420 [Termitomyces sp. T32_za158]|nr:hypothetical protein C0992_004420 [Termitomyces sp. T32_za158]
MTEPFPVVEAPPPYPSAFALPQYETATSLDAWADSYCLPPYQFRTARRFHPYMRVVRDRRARQEESFEEFLRSVQASTNHRAISPPVAAAEASVACTPPYPPARSINCQVSAPLPIATTLSSPGLPLPLPAPRPLAQDPDINPAEHRLSLVHRLFLVVWLSFFGSASQSSSEKHISQPEIIRIVRAGLRAAMRAAEMQKRKMDSAVRQ